MTSRTRRRLLRLLLIVALMGGAAMLAARPVVQRLLIEGLQRIGFQTPALRVHSLSLHRMAVRDLRTSGPVMLHVDHASVTYSPALLRQGQVDAIVVQGLDAQPADALDWSAAIAALHVTSTSGPPRWRSALLEGAHLVLAPGLTTEITTAHADAQSTGLTFTATAHLNGTALTIDGRYDSERKQVAADFAAPVIDLALWQSAMTKACGPRLPFLQRVQVSGQPAIDAGHVTYGGGLLDVSGSATLRGLALSSRAWDLDILGVNGPLTVRSAGDWITDGEQALDVDSVRVGKLTLTRGRIHYAVRRDGTVAIRAAAFAWGGGTLRLRDARIDPVAGVASFGLDMEHVALEDLLALVAAGRATGSGRLSGAWSLTARWKPHPRLDFGAGRLVADPGGGWFRVEHAGDAALLTGQLGRGKEAGAGFTKELADKIQRAMLDFEFDEFDVTFSPTNQILRTQIHTKGRGPRGKGALPFGGLTFNISGLDSLLQFLLVRQRPSDAQSTPGPGRARDGIAPTNRISPVQPEQAAIDAYF